ncbi:glycosyltransferase family 39 protein [Patescibacteria group bacterium]|nr:glycosyltransferase family 39 protein [Patescibacteria group bacterium]
MNIELFLIILVFLSSLTLLFLDKKLAVSVLLVLSVLLHKQLFKVYSWNFLPVRIFMLAFVVWSLYFVFKEFLKRKNIWFIFPYLKNPFILLLSLLWLVRGISILFTKNLSASLNLFAFFTTIVCLGIFLFLFLKNKPDQTLKYIKTYIYIVFSLCLFAFFQAYLYLSTGKIIGALWNVPDKFPRLGSLFWDVNHFGGLLAAILPVLGALILSAKKIKSAFLYVLMFFPMSVILVLTNSRTSWILAGVSGVIFFLLLLYKKFGRKGVIGLSFVLVLCLVGFLFEYSNHESPLRKKINEFFHYRMDSFDAHFMLIEGSIEIFDKFPVFGGGYGGFFEHFTTTTISAEYFGRDPAAFTTRVPAHTIWGEVLSETGLVGLVFFVLFIGLILGTLLYSFFISEAKEQALLSLAMFSSILGWLVAGIFYSYNSEFFFLILFLYFMYGVSVLGKNYELNKMLKFFTSRFDFGFIFIAVISFCLIFVSLGSTHLVPWDEAIYAGVAKNMVNTGEYMVMEWIPGKVWFEKPPLLMWLMAGFMHLLGIGEWAARLPSAIFGFLTILLVYTWAKKMFGKGAAFVSALALLTSVHFLYYARASMMDVTVTFFITLSLFLYYEAKRNFKPLFWLFSGVSVGLAIMTKGVIGFLPFVVIGLYELYLFSSRQQKFSLTLCKNYFLLILYAFIIILPWHLYMHQQFGMDFWANYIGYHVFDRAISAIEDKGQPFFWYLVVLKVSMRIWFVVLVPAFFYAISKAFRKQNDLVFILIWGVSIFLFFSIARSKLVWYIIPVYPAAVFLVGFFLTDVATMGIFVLSNLASIFTHLPTSIRDFVKKVSQPRETSLTLHFLVYFAITTFGLTYFYFNKKMVYTGDLTGKQARLIQYKDTRFGLEEVLYVDKVERPLPLFYSNGPVETVEFGHLQRQLKNAQEEDRQVVFITKSSRFDALKEEFPLILPVMQEKEWILGYLPTRIVEVSVGDPAGIQE